MHIFDDLSVISKKRKLKLFYKIVNPRPDNKILDVGAEISISQNRELKFIDSYPWKNKITALNISGKYTDLIKQNYPEVKTVIADARKLPFPDKSFDIVYSNAVIEHVGKFAEQIKMASEIMRVGKCWFVATPNRYYPFEFHLRLPFVTWLPKYSWIGKIIRYSHERQKYVFFAGYSQNSLNLLSAKRLKKCFPDSEIIKQRTTFMAEMLIAIGGI